MRLEFTVRSEGGKPDSLREAVKVAFVLTPIESGRSHPSNPLARWLYDFGVNSTRKISVSWESRISFDTYTTKSGYCYLSPDLFSPDVLPGQCLKLSPPPGKWGRPLPYDDHIAFRQSEMMVLNKAGSPKNILLALGSTGIVAYHPLENDAFITIPSQFQIQAYIVNDSTNDKAILKPEDLARPIFSTPLYFNELPARTLTWKLFQDQYGAIRLSCDEYPNLGAWPSATNQTLVKSVEEIRSQLAEVMKRLASLEKSVAHTQENVAAGQEGLTDLRGQLSAVEKSNAATSEALSCSNRTIVAVEAKAAILEKSFNQSQDRLAVVQKAMGDTQQLLAGMESVTKDQIRDLNRRFPAIETKAADSLERVSMVEGSVRRTRDDLSVVQQLVVSTNNQLSLMSQIPGAPMVAQSQPSSDLGRRVTTVEERTDKLEKEQRRYLHKLPAVETKADKLGISIGQTQMELTAAQVSISGLDHRIGALEARDIGDGEIGSLSSSSAGGSPVTFPSQLPDSPSRS